MKIEGYEEITEEEFNKSGSNNVAYFSDLKTNKIYHFKIIQEFPKAKEIKKWKQNN